MFARLRKADLRPDFTGGALFRQALRRQTRNWYSPLGMKSPGFVKKPGLSSAAFLAPAPIRSFGAGEIRSFHTRRGGEAPVSSSKLP